MASPAGPPGLVTAATQSVVMAALPVGAKNTDIKEKRQIPIQILIVVSKEESFASVIPRGTTHTKYLVICQVKIYLCRDFRFNAGENISQARAIVVKFTDSLAQ